MGLEVWLSLGRWGPLRQHQERALLPPEPLAASPTPAHAGTSSEACHTPGLGPGVHAAAACVPHPPGWTSLQLGGSFPPSCSPSSPGPPSWPGAMPRDLWVSELCPFPARTGLAFLACCPLLLRQGGPWQPRPTLTGAVLWVWASSLTSEACREGLLVYPSLVGGAASGGGCSQSPRLACRSATGLALTPGRGLRAFPPPTP